MERLQVLDTAETTALFGYFSRLKAVCARIYGIPDAADFKAAP